MAATREDLTTALWDAHTGVSTIQDFVDQLEIRLTRIGWYDPEIADIARRLARLEDAPADDADDADDADGFADESDDEDDEDGSNKRGSLSNFTRFNAIEERLCKLEARPVPIPHVCQCNRSKT